MKKILLISLCIGLAACSSTSNTAKEDSANRDKKSATSYGAADSPVCQSTGSRLKKKC